MTNTAATPSSTPTTPPAAIVFGLDDRGKPHASSFQPEELEVASRAASLMGLSVLPVSDDARRALALKCPAGRAFSSGKVFSPFVARSLFDQLCTAAGVTAEELAKLRASSAAAKPVESAPTPPSYDLPADRDAITVGSLVLATEGDGGGWFESIATAPADADGVFILAWRDYPDQEPFARHRDQLALLPPLAVDPA